MSRIRPAFMAVGLAGVAAALTASTAMAADRPGHLSAVPTWAAVSSGGGATCGVRPNHTAWCWGDNREGQLGIGTRAKAAARPTKLRHGSGWASIAAGDVHSCGIKVDHSLWCWGADQHGALGQG